MHGILSSNLSKLGLCIIFLFSSISACTDRDDELKKSCIQITQIPDWKTEDFKRNFTIQFPDTYEGRGVIWGFEGNVFKKNKLDGKIEFSHGFCTGTFCYDFGLTLEEPIPISIMTEDKNRNEITLGSIKQFCSNDDIIGYFYFNEEENATGKYYMKRDSVFLEGLTVYFADIEIQEVENIIKTIAEK